MGSGCWSAPATWQPSSAPPDPGAKGRKTKDGRPGAKDHRHSSLVLRLAHGRRHSSAALPDGEVEGLRPRGGGEGRSEQITPPCVAGAPARGAAPWPDAAPG